MGGGEAALTDLAESRKDRVAGGAGGLGGIEGVHGRDQRGKGHPLRLRREHRSDAGIRRCGEFTAFPPHSR
ncbi:hypothetical protein GCM10009532_01040 [Microbacterium aurantiacum]